MKRKRYTEEPIAFALRQAESGTPVSEIVRKMGVSEPTFYRWKKKYAGLGVAEVRRLKQLEEENRKSKRPSLLCSIHVPLLFCTNIPVAVLPFPYKTL